MQDETPRELVENNYQDCEQTGDIRASIFLEDIGVLKSWSGRPCQTFQNLTKNPERPYLKNRTTLVKDKRLFSDISLQSLKYV